MREVGTQRAANYLRLAVEGVRREYPNITQHMLTGPGDLIEPHVLSPAFYGCYDWHSAVHTHWTMTRLSRLYPDLAAEACRVLDQHLMPANLAVEAERCASRPWFERPYGRAWALALAAELARWDDPDAARWSAAMRPLVEVIEAGFADWLPRQRYPIRAGVHYNTAFSLTLVWDSAPGLADLIRDRALAWYGGDRAYDAGYEPSGNDFLSPALTEAMLMCRVLAPGEFSRWLEGFLPGLATDHNPLLVPVEVPDRADPHGVHLDGLNLSRAWCLRQLAATVGPDDPRSARLATAAEEHLDAALPHVCSGDFLGEHWLATFAVLALS